MKADTRSQPRPRQARHMASPSRSQSLLIPAALLALVSNAGYLRAQTSDTHATGSSQPHTPITAPATAVRSKATTALPAQLTNGNERPNEARIHWDGHGLEIDAFNASLGQILREVALVTGAKLEGFAQDQRIFGKFGPGPGCDVIARLLDGSGYNVLMKGSREANAPVEIVLSVRSPLAPSSALNKQPVSGPGHTTADKPDPEPLRAAAEAPQSQTTQDPFNIGGPPRNQVEFMQEILQRQQLIDQQAQQPNTRQ